MNKDMHFKRGYVYEVMDDERKHHPTVVIESTPNEHGRIKAIAFTHNEKGTTSCPNTPFPKQYVVAKHSKGFYQFQWEQSKNKKKNSSTSIINVGFLKLLTIISTKHIGRIRKAGLKWIEERVSSYEECDLPIKEASKAKNQQ